MPDIAIDACVFVHLFNPDFNTDKHIDSLLIKLKQDGFNLLVDSTDKIVTDYETQVKPLIKKTFDTGAKTYILRYWIREAKRVVVHLDRVDPLMTAIKNVIHEVDEHADRAFVYVAFRHDSTLVTNDRIHILGRCKDLLKRTKKYRGKCSKIRSSDEAKSFFCPDGGRP
jgi:hypothetical protein